MTQIVVGFSESTLKSLLIQSLENFVRFASNGVTIQRSGIISNAQHTLIKGIDGNTKDHKDQAIKEIAQDFMNVSLTVVGSFITHLSNNEVDESILISLMREGIKSHTRDITNINQMPLQSKPLLLRKVLDILVNRFDGAQANTELQLPPDQEIQYTKLLQLVENRIKAIEESEDIDYKIELEKFILCSGLGITDIYIIRGIIYLFINYIISMSSIASNVVTLEEVEISSRITDSDQHIQTTSQARIKPTNDLIENLLSKLSVYFCNLEVEIDDSITRLELKNTLEGYKMEEREA